MLEGNGFAEIAENLDGGKLLIFKRNEIYQARIYIGNRKYFDKSSLGEQYYIDASD